MKGQSDKVEVNQLGDPQGLHLNLRSNKENLLRENEQKFTCGICFTFGFYVTALLPRLVLLPVTLNESCCFNLPPSQENDATPGTRDLLG